MNKKQEKVLDTNYFYNNICFALEKFIPALESQSSQESKTFTEENIIKMIECPICKTEIEIEIPKQILDDDPKGIASILVSGLGIAECGHIFITFIDKNAKTRGYQLIDYDATNVAKGNNKKKTTRKKRGATK